MERLIERELGNTAAALSVEQVPELKFVREQALAEAESIIESRRPMWKPGEFEPVILPSDPITAAERLLEAEENYGLGSYQYEQALEAVMTDNRRALMEAYRKTTWEYFPPLEQPYDSSRGLYLAFGRPLIEMARDGLRWDKHAEERRRLANEYTEELTYHEFGGHELADTHWVLTVSPCPDHAIADPDGGYGYVPETEKMMIRGAHFFSDKRKGKRTRTMEQAALSGKLLDQDLILRTLDALGAIDSLHDISKTELQGKQILISKEKIPGVLGIVEMMDQTAGQDVFMGELRPDIERDYSSIEQQSKDRQVLLEKQAEELTDFMTSLARSGVNHVWAAVKIEQKINDLVHSRARTEPHIAYEAFGEKTAQGYEQAIDLDSQGNYQEADKIRIKTQNEAPSAAFCGAGSCGLRRATPTEVLHARSLGLSGNILALDEKRCPKGHATILFGKEGKSCSRCKEAEVKKKRRTQRKYPTKKSDKNKKTGFFG